MTGWRPERADLVAVLVILCGAALGAQYYREARTAQHDQQQARYETTARTRHARLIGEMALRRQSLKTLSAHFEASTQVEPSEFGAFSQNLLSSDRLQALCWFASDEGERFVAGRTEQDGALCQHYDVLEPSRAVEGEPPLLVLSSFAETRGTQQGFVSIVFSVGSLFRSPPTDDLREYLIVHNNIQNTVQAYQLDAQGAHRVSTQLVGPDYQSFELIRLGNIQFVYLTQQPAHSPMGTGPATVALALFALGLMAALYIRNLIRTRELVTREVALRTAELSQFAYRTSHDLRGPLVRVGALCRAVREDLEDGDVEEVTVNVARIEQHVGRLDRLVGDILQLTRADLGDTEDGLVDFEALIAELHERMADTFPRHGVSTEADVQVAPCLLPRGRIHQILENLISNGIKYADPDVRAPFVRTSVRAAGSTLTIEVRDNGRGIPAAHQPRLFQMFERFHPDVAPGSGLGLSIVKKHIERMSGQITVESSAAGTCFTVTLPTPDA